MVIYELSDLIDIKDFAYEWRLAGVSQSSMTDNLLARFCPLSEPRSQKVELQSRVFRDRGPFALNTQCYQVTENISLVEDEPDDTIRIQDWLTGLPVNPKEKVYVCWANAAPAVAAVTTWGVFIKRWSDLWYPFDVVTLFDETLDWAVLFGPEEYAVYAERGALRQQPSEESHRAGLGLVRAAA